jgi:hypothetical protein
MSRTTLLAIAIAGALNFILFCAGAFIIGGDAVNGEAFGGPNFLWDGSKLREVSPAVFTYSKLHALSLFVTSPLALLAWWAYNRR